MENQPPSAYNKKLISCYFDSTIDQSNCVETFKILHEILREKGNSGIAEYTPTVTFTLRSDVGSRIEIRMRYSFMIRKTTSINENDLFGCVKFVCNIIEAFIAHNRQDFGIAKLHPEGANLFPDFSAVLDLPY